MAREVSLPPIAPHSSLRTIADRLGAGCETVGDSDTQIVGIASDSRQVRPGSLFVALRGAESDGNEHVADAVQRGAAAIVTDLAPLADVPTLVVADARLAYGRIASELNGNPSHRIRVTAVTGTNGKTTVHWLLANALTRLGCPSLRIGTLGIFTPSTHYATPSSLTTPDPIVLQGVLALAATGGLTDACLEASSQALHQRRVVGTSIHTAIFTNLTHDHLDYHGSFSNYAESKLALVDLLDDSATAARRGYLIINLDDPFHKEVALRTRSTEVEILTFGESPGSDVLVDKWSQSRRGLHVRIVFHNVGHDIQLPTLGLHNASNLAAAFAALVARGIEPALAAQALDGSTLPPGRLELVPGKDVDIFVDYAHTPDAIARAVRTLTAVAQGSVWLVFGCGGDRDKSKRPEMLSAAHAEGARVVLTSDNPRSEDPMDIINEIRRGNNAPAHVEPDRTEAIRYALNSMKQADILLIAGKGHEDYQEIAGARYPFSDQAVATALLREHEGLSEDVSHPAEHVR